MTKRTHTTIALLIVALGATPVPAADVAPEARFLVSSDWLNAQRDSRDLRLLDVRSAEDYAIEHIDGAVSLPIEQLFVNDQGKRLIGPLQLVQSALGQAGIDNRTQVVVYDDGEFLSAARAFWVLEVYGHDRVAALDGGFAGWKHQGFQTATTAFVPAPRVFVPTVTPNRLATKLSTRLAVDNPGSIIIDARDRADYRGEKSAAQRFGHIRSAVNIPVMDHFDYIDGVKHLKNSDVLAKNYQGIDAHKKVVTYCNTGVLSATTYFVLRRLGYDVANYDGSWIEWGNDPLLPITEPGAARAPSTPAR